MRHKVAELDGALLDAAVALAGGAVSGGLGVWRWPAGVRLMAASWEPSANWSQGGPIIERERIALWPCGPDHQNGFWSAGYDVNVSSGQQCESGWLELPAIEATHEQTGRTSLIAAMRAYVASKYGEWIELPE